MATLDRRFLNTQFQTQEKYARSQSVASQYSAQLYAVPTTSENGDTETLGNRIEPERLKNVSENLRSKGLAAGNGPALNMPMAIQN